MAFYYSSLYKDEFLKALRLVLESTFFTFDDNIYNQKFGTPMSSPIIVIQLEDLECKALERFGTEIPFYFRYMDDIVTAISNHLIEKFLEVFNFHSRLQFGS